MCLQQKELRRRSSPRGQLGNVRIYNAPFKQPDPRRGTEGDCALIAMFNRVPNGPHSSGTKGNHFPALSGGRACQSFNSTVLANALAEPSIKSELTIPG
jgi:hypothetical protein